MCVRGPSEFSGRAVASAAVEFDPQPLCRHATFLGGSGSGKTTAALTVLLRRKTSDALEVDADDLQGSVVVRRRKLDPSRGLLAGALRAVRADASLLEDLPIADPNARVIAGMAWYMGRKGKPLRLRQARHTQGLGLSGQQAVSPLVLSLLKMKWLKRVSEHKYAAKKKDCLAAEYVCRGTGTVEARSPPRPLPRRPPA